MLCTYVHVYMCTGDPETKPFTARASVWLPISHQAQWSWTEWTCHGQWVRGICIFGVGDLPWLYRRPELFINKFYVSQESLAYDCMEELIYNRTVMEAAYHSGLYPTYLSLFESSTFDPTYYLNLPFVSHKSTSVIPLQETLSFLQWCAALPWTFINSANLAIICPSRRAKRTPILDNTSYTTDIVWLILHGLRLVLITAVLSCRFLSWCTVHPTSWLKSLPHWPTLLSHCYDYDITTVQQDSGLLSGFF